MNFFPIDLKKLIIAAVVIALPLFYFGQQSQQQLIPWYTVPFSLAGSLVQSGYSWLDHGIRNTIHQYVNLIDIRTDNQKLHAEQQLLKTQLSKMDELRTENRRLLGLLNFQAESEMDMIPARVVGDDLLTEHLTISINKGTLDGVSKGQAVAATTGVIGYILRAEPTSSLVLLVADRYAVIDALVQRTRARGVVEGVGPGRASLKYLERIDDVKVGDIIVTNGWDGIFPKGFPIAKVTSVEKGDYGISVNVDLKPVVDPDTIEEVFIIINSKGKNYLPESPQASKENP